MNNQIRTLENLDESELETVYATYSDAIGNSPQGGIFGVSNIVNQMYGGEPAEITQEVLREMVDGDEEEVMVFFISGIGKSLFDDLTHSCVAQMGHDQNEKVRELDKFKKVRLARWIILRSLVDTHNVIKIVDEVNN